MAVDPVSAISNAISELLKFISKLFRTAEEKQDMLDVKKRKKISRIKKQAKEYLKGQLP